MSRNPSSIEFLHRPAELFQHLRSRHIPLEERIQSAQQHFAHQDFSLPCKQLYFLRWIFQVEFFEPNRSNKSSKADPFTSPVHHTVFWKFLRQLVSDIGDSDLSSALAGTPPIILLRHALSEWHNLFNNPEFSLDVWSTLKVIFPIISQRLPFDLSLEILNQIFQGLNEFRHPISEPVEQIILLIINGVLPIIESTLNSRRAFNSIIMDHKALGRMLQAAFSPYATQPLKSLVFQIIQSFALNVENLKMVYLDQNTPIEWLDALHTIGKTSTSIGVLAHEYFPKFTDRIISVTPLIGVLLTTLLCASPIGQVAEVLKTQGAQLIIPVALLHAAAFALGYFLSKLCTFGESTSRTVAIECGMQSSALGFLLAQKHFTNPLVAVPSAVSVVCMALGGSALAVYWRNLGLPENDKDDFKE